LCWIADSQKPREVLINGLKRGVPPKRRHNPKFRPMLCKLSLLDLFQQTALQMHLPTHSSTYHEIKRGAWDYQNAKCVLQGIGGPFAGWITSGAEWEIFSLSDSSG